MKRKHKVERVEWIPVTYSYEVESEEEREGVVQKMHDLLTGKLNPDEEKKILASRTRIKLNDDFEAVSEVDEESYWKVDGKDEYDEK